MGVRLGKANARPMLGSSNLTRIKYRGTSRMVASDEIMHMVWKLGRSRRAFHVPGPQPSSRRKALLFCLCGLQAQAVEHVDWYANIPGYTVLRLVI